METLITNERLNYIRDKIKTEQLNISTNRLMETQMYEGMFLGFLIGLSDNEIEESFITVLKMGLLIGYELAQQEKLEELLNV